MNPQPRGTVCPNRARTDLWGASLDLRVKRPYPGSNDIECEIDPGSAKTVSLLFEGVNGVAYDVAAKTLQVLDRKHKWPIEKDGNLKLRILFDVMCIEVFGPDGLKVMSSVYKPGTLEQLDESRPKLALKVEGGNCALRKFTAWKMKSSRGEGWIG